MEHQNRSFRPIESPRQIPIASNWKYHNNDLAMKETPQQIAARLMAPASSSALWTYDQLETLLVQAIREERSEVKPRPPHRGKQE